jgi:hypothetical protein
MLSAEHMRNIWTLPEKDTDFFNLAGMPPVSGSGDLAMTMQVK